MKLFILIKILLKPHGKTAFLNKYKNKKNIFDVGSGNNSEYRVKKINQTCKYTGIDIFDSKNSYLDISNIIFCDPTEFSETIKNIEIKFEIVISSHNIEHCYNPKEVLIEILNVMKKDGCLFLAFPSKGSMYFPSRTGTLNYFDDKTHITNPLNFDEITKTLKKNNFDIEFSKDGYKPILLYLLGMFLEPFSKLFNKTLPGTWALWGFESIIWARKR